VEKKGFKESEKQRVRGVKDSRIQVGKAEGWKAGRLEG